jgi:hypothetical protein
MQQRWATVSLEPPGHLQKARKSTAQRAEHTRHKHNYPYCGMRSNRLQSATSNEIIRRHNSWGGVAVEPGCASSSYRAPHAASPSRFREPPHPATACPLWTGISPWRAACPGHLRCTRRTQGRCRCSASRCSGSSSPPPRRSSRHWPIDRRSRSHPRTLRPRRPGPRSSHCTSVTKVQG